MTLTLTGSARTRDDPCKLNLREHLTAALERWPLELRKLVVFGQWRRWGSKTPHRARIQWDISISASLAEMEGP